ncbi:hypothetical protein T484DRAFT_1898292 [Baffinella frigidus]|nr:hypothetical protein T484DRAFT_1898292 [Cryptophyta sp. CCMP2293]
MVEWMDSAPAPTRLLAADGAKRSARGSGLVRVLFLLVAALLPAFAVQGDKRGETAMDAGSRLFHAGDLTGAAAAFLDASQARPTDPAPLSNFAFTLQALGRSEEAHASFTHARTRASAALERTESGASPERTRGSSAAERPRAAEREDAKEGEGRGGGELERERGVVSETEGQEMERERRRERERERERERGRERERERGRGRERERERRREEELEELERAWIGLSISLPGASNQAPHANTLREALTSERRMQTRSGKP